jgi:hypothetical protein
MHEEGLPVIPVNMSTLDRVLRIALGLTIFAIGASGLFTDTAGAVIRIVSLLPFATGGFGWDPIYALFGFATTKGAITPVEVLSSPANRHDRAA